MLATVHIVWGGLLWIAASAPLERRLFIDVSIVANLARRGDACATDRREGEKASHVGREWQ